MTFLCINKSAFEIRACYLEVLTQFKIKPEKVISVEIHLVVMEESLGVAHRAR